MSDRGAWLTDADIGVSAHFDDVETRFSFRTRLLDCVWAGLPTVSTEGDDVGEQIARSGGGHIVPVEDVDAWVRALAPLVDDEQARSDARRALEPLAIGVRVAARGRTPRRAARTAGTPTVRGSGRRACSRSGSERCAPACRSRCAAPAAPSSVR